MDKLAQLERRVEQELALTSYPSREWVEARTTSAGERIYDVLIIGGGQSGLACAFGLRRERVTNVLVIDDQPEDRAGPWLNFARMHTLRTPKHVTGPDLGLPSLTVQAWWEAQHGPGSWGELGLLPKESWAAYLAWYRRVLELPVRWQTKGGALEWLAAERCFAVPTRSPEGEAIIHARRVVLATGIEGSGDWYVPPFISESLPRERYAHTRWDIDFEALRGKRVGVLGAGASAFDNASVAHEAGAASVDLFFRRPALVKINPYRWAEFVGFLRHAADLPDADRWRFIRQIIRMGQLPPTDTYARATQASNFTLHPGSAWTKVGLEGEEIVVTTAKGQQRMDFAIVATGFRTDLGKRPELARVVDHISLWGERYTPPEAETHADLLRHPYLGPGFEFVPRDPAAAPWLTYIYNYTFGCLLSHGFGGASISGMKYSLPRLVGGITRSLFTEDKDAYFNSLASYDTPDF